MSLPSASSGAPAMGSPSSDRISDSSPSSSQGSGHHGKRPMPPSGTSGSPAALSQLFPAKRPRPLPGAGLKLRVVQRAGAMTDVTGDTENCKEMLLKPLGFRWNKPLKVWRWEAIFCKHALSVGKDNWHELAANGREWNENIPSMAARHLHNR